MVTRSSTCDIVQATSSCFLFFGNLLPLSADLLWGWLHHLCEWIKCACGYLPPCSRWWIIYYCVLYSWEAKLHFFLQFSFMLPPPLPTPLPLSFLPHTSDHMRKGDGKCACRPLPWIPSALFPVVGLFACVHFIPVNYALPRHHQRKYLFWILCSVS